MQRISVSKNNKCMSLGLPYNQVPLYERFTKGSLRDAGLCTMMFKYYETHRHVKLFFKMGV